MSDLAKIRQEYGDSGLSESDATPSPLTLFRIWMQDAVASGMHEPNAMVLATVKDGQPSARTVLLKGLDEGFLFYTNYGSRKGTELLLNPKCSLVFPWHPISRQVRIEGVAHKLTNEENTAYWESRPPGAQMSAWASAQSKVVGSRWELENRAAGVRARFSAGFPLPNHWGGYRIIPTVVEFWQGRAARMHDRLRYRVEGDRWVIERLAP